jgi:hypothetical protein
MVSVVKERVQVTYRNFALVHVPIPNSNRASALRHVTRWSSRTTHFEDDTEPKEEDYLDENTIADTMAYPEGHQGDKASAFSVVSA